MKLLFIGDVVGQNGCDFLSKKIYHIKKEHNIDITVINGENSATGNGITRNSADFLFNIGADVITTGNHCFKRRESAEIFEDDRILRPLNYPEGCIGKGICTIDFGAFKVAVINLMGTVGLEPLDNPFTCIDNILKSINTPNIFVDFHAEATSEKKAMGHYLAKRVTAVLGTHTHVQTADEIILENHTAYITDAGMTGAELSVLGVDTKPVIERFRFHYPERFTESTNPCFINGVVITFDEKLGKSNKIERIIVR
ncbi:MAG: TIGR00282 family metallophosphoesterase [Oscillospiraceae bacterium]|nr:TIGR00282 family metallophosphoesterase [Oscillospiraceae bacterium]